VSGKPTYTLGASTDLDKKITTINYDAMSTMYKVMNPPLYSKIWQSAAQTIDKMNTQSFQLYLYAPFLNANYFNTGNRAVILTDVTGA